jgi:signal transduction histidine kinase
MLIVGMLPLVLMGIISMTVGRTIVQRVAHDSMNLLAEEIGKEVNRAVNEGYRNILLLSQNPVVRSETAGRDYKLEELTKTQKYHSIFSDITLLDLEGEVIASVFHSFRGTWKTKDWFLTAAMGTPVISDVHSVLYPFDIVMTMASPVFENSGRMGGVLVGQIDMERIWQITENVQIGKEGEVLIVDHRGVTIAGPEEEKLLEHVENETIHEAALNIEKRTVKFNKNGIKYVAVTVPIDSAENDYNLNWEVVLIQEQKAVYAPEYHVRNYLFIAVISCLLVVAMLSFLFSRKVSKRINRLVDATVHLARGDFSNKIEYLGNDEIGELGKAFNQAGQQLETSRKKSQLAEDALRKTRDELEVRVNKRTTELELANKHLKNEVGERKQAEKRLFEAMLQAEMANKAKSDFLANMSHELRTPLNHIIGFTELAMEKKIGDLNEAQKEYLDDVIQSSRHLLSLINDILDLSKIEAGRQELVTSRIDLKMLLENSTLMIKEKAMKHGIQVVTKFKDIPESIIADERKLKQIVYNLLSNAVKFTPDKGEIVLAARYFSTYSSFPNFPDAEGEDEGQVNGGAVEISVSDTGIGLKKEDLDIVFTSFEQVESSVARRFQGTGLGLSLTRKLVELHGGSIWAESEGEGKGTTFRFLIPANIPVS